MRVLQVLVRANERMQLTWLTGAPSRAASVHRRAVGRCGLGSTATQLMRAVSWHDKAGVSSPVWRPAHFEVQSRFGPAFGGVRRRVGFGKVRLARRESGGTNPHLAESPFGQRGWRAEMRVGGRGVGRVERRRPLRGPGPSRRRCPGRRFARWSRGWLVGTGGAPLSQGAAHEIA